MHLLHNQTYLFQNSPATGGTITTIGPYTVHTFTANGTFTTGPDPLINAYYFIVGGGGGGGAGGNTVGNIWYSGGGGGSGAVVTNDPYPITLSGSTAFAIVVGNRGIGGTTSVASTSGQASSALGYTALGGGNGGQLITSTVAANGGAGGGGSAGGNLSAWPSGNVTSKGTTIQSTTYGYGSGFDGYPGKNNPVVGGLYSALGGGGGGSKGPGGQSTAYTGGNATVLFSTSYAAGGNGGYYNYQSGTFSSYAGSAPTTPGGGGGGGTATLTPNGRIEGTNGNSGVVIIYYQTGPV